MIQLFREFINRQNKEKAIKKGETTYVYIQDVETCHVMNLNNELQFTMFLKNEKITYKYPDFDVIFEYKRKEKIENLAIEVKQNYNVNDMILERINDKYAWVAFGNVKLIVMLENGYFNASHLCKLGNKVFRDWYRGDNLNYVNYVEKQINEPCANLHPVKKAIIKINGGPKDAFRGSYVHPDIVVSIATWISHEFRFMVNRIVMNYFAEHHSAEIKKELLLVQKESIMKDDKIDRLIKESREQTQLLRKQSDDIEYLKQKNDELLYQTKSINNKLDYVKQEYVIPSTKPGDITIFKLYVNYQNEPITNNAKPFKYTVIRCMMKSFSACYKRHIDKYPRAKEIYELVDPVRSLKMLFEVNNLWNRVKIECKLDTSYASFNLPSNYDERRLIDDIRSNAELRFQF